MRLPEISVKRPVATLMVFLAIFIMSIVSLFFLKIDLLPNIEPPAISIIIPYPGASASDVESDVTKYIEDQMTGVNNLDSLYSISKDNLSVVTCKFSWGTNLDVAINDVRDKLDMAKYDVRQHAPDAEEPMVFKFSSAMMPVLVLSITATESYKQLYHIVDKQISDELKRVPGVGATIIYGGLRRQIGVYFNKQKLEAYNLTPQQIIQVLQAQNIEFPAGSVKIGQREYHLRVPGRFKDVEEIANTVVASSNGRLVYLKDVAEVKDDFKEERMLGYVKGKPAVIMLVQKQTGTNTVEVIKRVKKRLLTLKRELPADIEITIPMDASEFIMRSLNNLLETLAICFISVAIITLLFLRRFSATGVIVSAIPFSMIIALIYIFLRGYTINVVSLLSLAMVIGLVVDDAVVVLENITRHIEEGGEKPHEAAMFGASEVGLAVSAATLTKVIVFTPLIFVSGITAIIFGQLASIFAITLVASLLTSLSLTPMLASRLLKIEKTQKRGKNLWDKFAEMLDKLYRSLEALYSRVLHLALVHRLKLIFILAAIFLINIVLVKYMTTEFFPKVDTGEIQISVELNESARLEESGRVALQIADLIKKLVPEAIIDYAFAGESEKGIGVAMGMAEGVNIAQGGAKLVKKSARHRSAEQIANILRREIRKIPGIEKMSVASTTPMKQMIMGGGKPISIEITGDNLDVLNKVADEIKRIVEKIPGATDVTTSAKKPREEIWVKVNRTKASSLGVDVASVSHILRQNYYGFEATKYRDASEDFDIFVRLRDEERRTLDDIGEVAIPTITNRLVKLKSIAEIKPALGPPQIDRKNRQRIVKVECNTYGRPQGAVKADIDKEIKKMTLPPGVKINYGGEIEEQRKAFRDLGRLLVVGILLIYMIMAAQFESFKMPFIIMFSVPFAFVGVLWGFLITGTALNLMSFIGIIMLMGIAVSNAIILVDYTNILRARGVGLYDAVRQAGAHRLRPVLMTTMTTLIGMFPLAVKAGEGAEMWHPFAIAVISGLTLSTFVTLILIPIMYSIVEGFSVKELKKYLQEKVK